LKKKRGGGGLQRAAGRNRSLKSRGNLSLSSSGGGFTKGSSITRRCTLGRGGALVYEKKTVRRAEEEKGPNVRLGKPPSIRAFQGKMGNGQGVLSKGRSL